MPDLYRRIVAIMTIWFHINITLTVDETVYIRISESVRLPCQAEGKPFLSGSVIVIWYKTETITDDTIICAYLINSNDHVVYRPAYTPGKHVCNKTDHSLTIHNLTSRDNIKYRCIAEGDSKEYTNGVLIQLVELVPPSQPIITTWTFQENSPKSINCSVFSVNPGKGSLVFTVSVRPDFSIMSSDSDLTEVPADPTTGVVSVTYSAEITLQRKHNGQQAVCQATWQDEETNSLGKNVTVQFSASSIIISKSPTGLVAEGALMTFTCLTDEANPTATVTWTVEGISRSSTSDSSVNDGIYNARKRRSVLFLTADKTLHNKVVKCAVSGKPVVKATETLNIAYIEPPLTLAGSPGAGVPVPERTSVTFTCSVDANPTPTYSLWTSNNRDVQKWDDMAGYSITLSLQKQHNKVVILCRADGSLTGYPILSPKEKYYTVEFSASSIIMSQSPSVAVTENTEVVFTCVTDEAQPTAEVVWTVGRSSRSSTIDSTEDGLYNTQKRTSELRLTVDRTLNEKVVKCHVSGKSSVKDTEMLNVTYSPFVSVQGSTNPYKEGFTFTLTCNIQVGNPEKIISHFWEFEPKYPGSQSQVLPEQREQRELVIESAVYTDAGIYTCTAGNTVGSDKDQTQIISHYSPKLLGNEKELLFYSGLNQNVTVALAVRALPEFTDVNAAFKWMRPNSSEIITGIQSSKLGEELFQSVLVINSVKAKDYGYYTVSVDNGIGGPENFALELQERGPPEGPKDVSVIAVAAEKANVSWVPGLNGGFEQKFTVVYKIAKSDKEHSNTAHYVNQPAGKVVYFLITNLIPETRYQVRVISMNDFNGGSDESSDYITLITRAQPTIDNAGISAILTTQSTAILHWKYIVPDGGYTAVIIEQCNTTHDCTAHIVTEHTNQTLEVYLSDGEIFYMIIYQDGLESYRSQRFTLRPPEPTNPPDASESKSSSTGGIVGGSIAVTAVALAVLLAIWYHRKRDRQQASKQEGNKSEMPFYVNISQPGGDTYQNLESRRIGDISPYQDLNTKTISVLNGNQVYEDIKNIKEGFENENLFHGKAVHQSQYFTIKKGVLKTTKDCIDVIIKFCRAEYRSIQGEYLTNQITCLEQVGQHNGIAEIFPMKASEASGQTVDLVMKYYQGGDLKTFLNNISNTVTLTELRIKVTDILGTLAYLESFRPEILHYRLSAEHILVDERGSCKLIGFGLAVDVQNREIEEENDGEYGAIEWKAPETIEDCKAHTKLSDVWAFGVLLHEIYTLGKSPYEGMIEDDIKSFVRSGKILDKVDGCPTDIYNIMQKCWSYDAKNRPSFQTLLSEFKQLDDSGNMENQKDTQWE